MGISSVSPEIGCVFRLVLPGIGYVFRLFDLR